MEIWMEIITHGQRSISCPLNDTKLNRSVLDERSVSVDHVLRINSYALQNSWPPSGPLLNTGVNQLGVDS
jgi:hypothetical protein